MIARDQLRSIFDRWSQHREAEQAAAGDTYGYLAYLAKALGPFADDRTTFTHRAFRSAAEQVGLDKDFLRSICKAVARRGSMAAYLAHREMPPALPRLMVTPLSRDSVGHVYVARVAAFPHVLKIGFSRRPEERMKRLTWETGEDHVLEEAYPGTLVEEALIHRLRYEWHIVREWFFDPDHESRIHPSFLPLSAAEILKTWDAAA